MMRILAIHNDYAAPSGEEFMFERIVRLLEDRGHEVAQYRKSSAEILRSRRTAIAAAISSVLPSWTRREVGLLVDKFQPNVVQIQNLYPQISPWILPILKQRSIPVVMRCANYRLVCPTGLLMTHGRLCTRCVNGREYNCVLQRCHKNLAFSALYALRNWTARVMRLYTDNVTLFYSQTKFQKNVLVHAGFPEARIHVIPNMIEGRNGIDDRPRGSYCAFVGRVSAEKGISVFLKAAARLPQILFRVAGHAPDGGLINSHTANVTFCGHLSGAALQRFYEGALLIVVPSLCYEGFPNVLLEAMTQKIPIICSDLGGLPEIVDWGAIGVLFEPGDSKDLADKIEFLYNDERYCKALVEAAYTKVRVEYTSNRYYERLMNAYEAAQTLA